MDAIEAQARALVQAAEDAGWAVDAMAGVVESQLGQADPAIGGSWSSPPTEIVPRLAGTTRRADRGAARAGRRLRRRRAVRFAAARADQRAAHRPELLLRRPEGGAVPAGLRHRPGDGRIADRPVPHRHRRLPAVGGPVGVGHLGDADRRRRHRRGAGADRGDAGVGRGVPPGHRPARRPAGRPGPAADRRHRPDLRLLPGRLPARGHHAGRRGADGRRPGRAGRASTTSAPTPGPTWPSTATTAGPPPGSSVPRRAPTGPGCCR